MKRWSVTATILAASALLAGCARERPCPRLSTASDGTRTDGTVAKHCRAVRLSVSSEWWKGDESPWPLVFGPDKARFNGPDNSHYPQ